jgi:hypothetical protein
MTKKNEVEENVEEVVLEPVVDETEVEQEVETVIEGLEEAEALAEAMAKVNFVPQRNPDTLLLSNGMSLGLDVFEEGERALVLAAINDNSNKPITLRLVGNGLVTVCKAQIVGLIETVG